MLFSDKENVEKRLSLLQKEGVIYASKKVECDCDP